MKKQYNVVATLNTVASLLTDCGMNAALSAYAQTQISIDQLIKAIDKKDAAFLTTIKNIGKKRAEQIVSRGSEILAQQRKPAKCKPWYYHANSYTVEQMFDVKEQDIIRQLGETSSLTPVSDVVSILTEWKHYEQACIKAKMGLVAHDNPSVDSLPSSMLAYRLGIEPDTATNKVCLYKHKTSQILTFKCDRRNAMPGAIRDMNMLLKECRKLFLFRANRFGFRTPMGEHYLLYTKSPSQLKKEGAYFIIKQAAKENQDLFWFGLGLDEVAARTNKMNSDGKLVGTVCMTKLLQYRALLTSAAIPSSQVFGKPIDMRKVIVVPEFEKIMTAHVMSVATDYTVSEGIRDDIKNPLWDGQIILNARKFGLVMAQLRSMGLKGLAVGVNVPSLCAKRGYDPVVTDVNGVKHNLEIEDWHMIADPSTLKMLKIFGGTKHYFETLEKLGMTEAFVCAVDGEEKDYNTLSRQMVSSLFDLEDDEMTALANPTVDELLGMKNLQQATRYMAEDGKSHKTNMGKLISACPEAMALDAIQSELKDRFLRRMDSARAGKLVVNGKYMFAVCDPVAWVDIVIGGKDPSDPSVGVLRANEVSCAEFPIGNELIALRSPHAAHEWAVAVNMKSHVDVAAGGISFSVHDLIYRMLQMDFDGDHILVVDNEKLTSSVKRMQKKYNIPVIYYEASKPNSLKPLPVDPDPQAKHDELASQIVECALTCAEYNKVGEYSNYVCSAWSQVMPDAEYDWMRATLRIIAQLAAGINHAVDAQKTYAMDKLPWDMCQQYKAVPHNQRFHRATENMPSSHPMWDSITQPRGMGSVDRLAAHIEHYVPMEWSMDTSSLTFDWSMLCDKSDKYSRQIWSAVLPQSVRNMISAWGKANGESEIKTYNAIMNGDRVGLMQVFRLLNHQSQVFFKEYKREHANEDGAEIEINRMKTNRNDVMCSILTEFVRASKTPGTQDMTDIELLTYAAMQLLRNTFTHSVNNWQITTIFRLFGDLYARAAEENRGAMLKNLSDEELKESVSDDAGVPNVEDDAYFDVESLQIPGEDDGCFIFNEMDDVF